MENLFDICIVGGGVAGATLAAYLGKSNIRIAVIEKSLAEQDRIIGELLQPGGVEMLEKMNLAHLLEGFDAQPMQGYGLFMNGESFKIPYPTAAVERGGSPFRGASGGGPSLCTAVLPFPLEGARGQIRTGHGLRNGKFLQKIREYAFGCGNVTVIEGSAIGLIEDDGAVTGISYRAKGTDEIAEIKATLTVLSDGIFSTFRSSLSAAPKKVSGHFMGLLLKDCVLPYANHGHVIITDSSPVLVYPVSSTETRVLIDFPGDEPPKKGEELTNFLKHNIGAQMPESIKPSFYSAVDEGKFKVMPNHLMAARPIMKNGAVLLGDSLNMRHPLTGGGMTVAFTDVYLLGTRLKRLNAFNKTAVFEEVKAFYKTRNAQSASINILADALYGVMGNNDLKQACFNYLKRGGAYSREPVSILSAVSRDVSLLIRHFFAVAVYGVRKLVFPIPSPSKIKRSYRMLADAVKILSPLLKNERLTTVPRVLAMFF